MPYKLSKNPVKEAIRKKEHSFGLYIATDSPSLIELAAVSGFDWVRIDWSHTPLDLQAITNMIRAAEAYNITPFIRLDLDEQKISSVLELGIQGIIVPDISTAQEAQEAVNSAKFSPVGKRGMFSVPRMSGYGSVHGGDFTKWSNDEVIVAIQIEDKEAIDNIEDILSVEGIDMVLSGRGDLANSFGVPGQKNHPLVTESEEKIFEIATKKGIAISPQLDPSNEGIDEEVKKWIDYGANVISFGHDISIIKNALTNVAKMANNVVHKP